MQRYIFIGSFTEIGDRTYSRVGQSADWDEVFYRSNSMNGAPFIPETEFKKVGFTQDELDRYADFGNRALAPESFNAKVKACALILHDLRARRSTPEVSTSQEMPAASCS